MCDKHIQYYKITKFGENHHGHQYNDGLNILSDTFNDDPHIPHCRGGFYVTVNDYIAHFIFMGYYLREIELPVNDPDFKMIKSSKREWRVNQLILGKKYELSNPETWTLLISKGLPQKHILKYVVKWAIIRNYTKLIEYFVTNININVNDILPQTSHYASNSFKIVKFLIKMGADVNLIDHSAFEDLFFRYPRQQ